MRSESGGGQIAASMAEETQDIYTKRDNACSVPGPHVCWRKRRELGNQGREVWVDVGCPPAQVACCEAKKEESRACVQQSQGPSQRKTTTSSQRRRMMCQKRSITNCCLIFYSSFYIHFPSPSLSFKFPGHRIHASPFIPFKQTM